MEDVRWGMQLSMACGVWPAGWRSCGLGGAQLDPTSGCRTDWPPLEQSSKPSLAAFGWLSMQGRSFPARGRPHPPCGGSVELSSWGLLGGSWGLSLFFSFACVPASGNPVFFRNRKEDEPLRTGLRRSLCLSLREFRMPEGLCVLSPLSLAEGPHAEVHHTGGPLRGRVPWVSPSLEPSVSQRR